MRAVMKGGRVVQIHLIDEAVAVLRRIQKITGNDEGGRMFPFGSKRASTNLTAWAEVMDMETSYLHAFRHYFASAAISAGIPIPVVAELLGHKDGGILLMRTYAHLIPGAVAEAARKLSILTVQKPT